MKKSKVYLISIGIACIMCTLTSSLPFLYSERIINYNESSFAIYEIIHNIFNLKVIMPLNVVLSSVFFFNLVIIILTLTHTNNKYVKYVNMLSIMVLCAGIILYVIHVISYIMFFYISTYEYYSLKFKIMRWIPRILIFMIPTLYLLICQIYFNCKTRNIKINHNLVLIGSFVFSLLFLSFITFVRFSIYTDLFLGRIRLIIPPRIQGDLVMGRTIVNYNCFFWSIFIITFIYGFLLIAKSLILRKRRY